MIEKIYHDDVVPINNASLETVLEEVDTLLEKRNNPYIENPPPTHLIPLGVAMYLNALNPEQERFSGILDKSITFPDSSGLHLLSRFVEPGLHITTGGDVARGTVKLIDKRKQTVCLVGSNSLNRRRAAMVIDGENPNLSVITYEGRDDFECVKDSHAIADFLAKTTPDFVLLAAYEILGQEWIDKWIIQQGIDVGVIGNFGQIIDVWAGNRPVPHEIFRDNGLGWMFRIMMETPERRKRYIKVLNKFAIHLCKKIVESYK